MKKWKKPMSQTRLIQGEIIFPDTASQGVAETITVELRDVSVQDQASTVVAAMTLKQVPLDPNCRVPFELEAPIVAASRSLSLRVQVDMQVGQRHASGDFLSTAAQPVPPGSNLFGLLVPVTQL
jgi:uncharacterized lipoprotein YbaY